MSTPQLAIDIPSTIHRAAVPADGRASILEDVPLLNPQDCIGVTRSIVPGLNG